MKVLRKSFSQALDPVVAKFVCCVGDDHYIAKADIQGSLAHVKMLESTGLLSAEQSLKIQGGLLILMQQLNEGTLKLDPEFEDVHMNVEKQLELLIGADAKLLHTGRSRNDQVAIDLRIFALQQMSKLAHGLKQLCEALSKTALHNLHCVVPGYTHMQPAQPTLFAHALHAYIEMFSRDIDRLVDAKERTAVSPLGAAALVGTSLPLEPQLSAELLGYEKSFANSMDAVSDRDFIAELLFVCSMISLHLSQLAETLMIWNTKEFGFVQFPDSLTTASSLMPQKKNADPVELVRSKSGLVCGELVNVLIVLKALPLGYNRDLQDAKQPAIRATEVVVECLSVMTLAIKEMRICQERTLEAASHPELMSTDLLEYLVIKGVAFRQAHDDVSQLVAYARNTGKLLTQLKLEEFKQFNECFDGEVFTIFDAQRSVQSKSTGGSTNPALVQSAIQKSMITIKSYEV